MTLRGPERREAIKTVRRGIRRLIPGLSVRQSADGSDYLEITRLDKQANAFTEEEGQKLWTVGIIAGYSCALISPAQLRDVTARFS